MSRESKRKINVSLWNGLRERRRSKHVPRVAARQRHGRHAIEAAEGASPPDGISLPGMPEGHPRHALHRRWRPQDEEDVQGARRIRRGVLVRRGNVPPRGELGLRRRRPREPPNRGRQSVSVRMRPLQPPLLRHKSMQHRPDEPVQPEVPHLLRERECGRVRLRTDL